MVPSYLKCISILVVILYFGIKLRVFFTPISTECHLFKDLCNKYMTINHRRSLIYQLGICRIPKSDDIAVENGINCENAELIGPVNDEIDFKISLLFNEYMISIFEKYVFCVFIPIIIYWIWTLRSPRTDARWFPTHEHPHDFENELALEQKVDHLHRNCLHRSDSTEHSTVFGHH